jgi:predicted dehydrogenase
MAFLSRRDFMKESALFAAAAAALGETTYAADAVPARKVGPNERLRVAVIGYKGRDPKKAINGRGGSAINAFAGLPDTVVTTLCDCDSTLSDKACDQVAAMQKVRPTYVQDLRKVLDDKSIDIISIATPNHWHALAAIWAIQAGKDVYVEKPVSHNVAEGRRIVEFARKHNKIVQTGTQSRTGSREVMEFLHKGGIGKLSLARALCYKNRPSIGPKTETKAPDGVDYDLWCGPAPMAAITRKQFHYDWHWMWDYGNGDLGNQGIHEMDRARWGLGKNTLASAVFSLGGRFGYTDAGETANTQLCLFDYGDSQLIFEVRGLPSNDYKGAKVGVVFYGSNGYVVSTSYTDAVAFTPDGHKNLVFKGPGEREHFANFVKAVKSRKVSDLNGDIEEGHLSSALCHLGNISYRLGTEQKYNPNGKVVDDIGNMAWSLLADESTTRMMEHLKENKVDLVSLNLKVGRRLKLDPKTETFAGDADANRLLTREYRKGFVVPEKA